MKLREEVPLARVIAAVRPLLLVARNPTAAGGHAIRGDNAGYGAAGRSSFGA